MTIVAENIKVILAQISHLEQQYGRTAGSVKLLAVSKKQPMEKIVSANLAGLNDFGENYLQEAAVKIEELKQLALCWHFIGPIQSNKTKAIAEHFQWVHSVDRVKVAQRLNQHRESSSLPLNVCVQVNLSGEASKSGTALDQTDALCREIAELPNLKLRGLMAIPAALNNLEAQRASFRQLRDAFVRLQSTYSSMDTLSMGMSGDFEAAIAEGSTLLRIGTGIFGRRD